MLARKFVRVNWNGSICACFIVLLNAFTTTSISNAIISNQTICIQLDCHSSLASCVLLQLATYNTRLYYHLHAIQTQWCCSCCVALHGSDRWMCGHRVIRVSQFGAATSLTSAAGGSISPNNKPKPKSKPEPKLKPVPNPKSIVSGRPVDDTFPTSD